MSFIFYRLLLLLCIVGVGMQNIVRKPNEFQYGEDFDLFFRQFCTFAKNVKCDTAAQYNLLLSFLDKKSFRLAEGIVFSNEELAAVALDLDAALPKLKQALIISDELPANVRLRFRKQGNSESLGDFGYAIQGLGITAYTLVVLLLLVTRDLGRVFSFHILRFIFRLFRITWIIFWITCIIFRSREVRFT